MNDPFEPVAGLQSGIESVTLGAGFGCTTTLLNGIKCWGANQFGQLGDGSIGIAKGAAGDVSGATENTLMVDAGSKHTCAVTMDGAVKCWGSDSNGQVGDAGRSHLLAAAVVSDPSRSRIASPSNAGNAGSDAAVVDAIARFTVFESSASNLMPGDNNHSIDVFRRDGSDGSVMRISVADDESEIDGDSIEPSVSASGQWVVFVAPDSAAGKLRGESIAARKQRPKSSTHGVFLRNVSTGSTQRVGTALPGGRGTRPVIAPLGDAIAFTGLPTIPGQGTPGVSTILVVPLQLTGNELLPGLPSCPLCAPSGNALSQSPSWNPVLSADGRWLAFETEAANVPGLADIAGVATESSTRFADVILSFTGSGALSFDYAVIGGPTQRKQMSRFIFAGDDIVCRISPFPSRGSTGNLSDIWWGGAATAGWGILLSESTSIMAATWYTFDQDREAIFLIAITTRQPDGSFMGSMFRQRNGTPFGNNNNAPPSSGSDAIGTARFDIIDGETADFSYTVGAVSQTKRISRFVFGATPNVCSTARP